MSSTQTLRSARAVPVSDDSPRWFSANPDRAWAEKFFLIYSPIWMILMGIMMPTGWAQSFSDTALLVHGVLVAAPIFLVPLLLRRHANPDRPWYDSYWFKANLYIGLFGFFGNYFGSEYFFDVLGMVYNMPNVTTALDAKLVGSGDQPVPLIMYLYTHAHVHHLSHRDHRAAPHRDRASSTSACVSAHRPNGLLLGLAGNQGDGQSDDGDVVLLPTWKRMAYGSAICLAIFHRQFSDRYYLDESATARWDLWRVAAAGMSASMLTFYLLDAAAWWVGSL
ncbi:MAG: hypothetical protein R3F38_03250 [Gammaproteobacteria bacterium]